MNKILRMLWLALRSRRWPRLGLHDVARTPFRVRLTDIDLLRHMNNGVYFSMLDLGRIDLLRRSGGWAELQRRGWYPVVVQETMTFRKSLNFWARYILETRLIGVDEKGVYIEQRFTVDGEVYARGYVRGRFLKKTGGVVTMTELLEVFPAPAEGYPDMAWLNEWSQRSALPPGKAPAPSIW